MNKAKLIIFMGISGSGKSSLASRFADEFNYEFVEADDFHSQQAKALMSNNITITDDMRQHWISRIIARLKLLNNHNVVMAYSGLKAAHRQQFRQLDFDVSFIFLSGQESTISHRLAQRNNHFVNQDFVGSQLNDLETPSTEELDTHVVNIDQSLDDVYQSAKQLLSV